MIELPIDPVLADVRASAARPENLVLLAAPGSGKTTRVPPALASVLAGKVVVLEPRRIAARSAAVRVASELDTRVGRKVGYRVRFDARAGPATRIEYVTEGTFVRALQANPELAGVAAVVFDEFHERNLASDLALALVRDVQRALRTDLVIVVMSATLDPAPLAAFLGAPVLEAGARPYPVEVETLSPPARASTVDAAVLGVERALALDGDGDVLAFLPGVGEIRRARERLAGRAERRGADLVELYGDLPLERQDAALRAAPRRRVVLATNVAETSVTVEGVTTVVDTGVCRQNRFDPALGLDRLELVRIARASVEQRAGRAGRTGPGRCIRVWDPREDALRPSAEEPEIRRVDLAGALLELFAWGERDVRSFGWFERPPDASIERALDLLERLGALSGHGLTEHGRALARLPVPPRLASLLVRSPGPRAALLCALVAERDPIRRGTASRGRLSDSDVLDRLELVERFERTGQIDSDVGQLVPGAARHALRARDQLRRSLDSEPARESRDDLARALLDAFPDRVARRRADDPSRAVLVGGRGLRLADECAVREGELFLAIDLDAGRRGERSEALVRQASGIERTWLDPAFLATADTVELDERRGAVRGVRRTSWAGLVLDEVDVRPRADEAERLLARIAAERLDDALALDQPDVASFLARVRSLAHWRPELELPTFERDDWIELLPELCRGARSLADLRSAPLLGLLRTRVGARLGDLERDAPERLEVPSGSRVRLRYEPGRPPVLAVRIQEIFGWRETPRVAGGRVPVLLHLLGPNHRPQQVTDDLASFWRTTYADVRKDLRRRYPRHAWPEDPLAARAQRRPGGR